MIFLTSRAENRLPWSVAWTAGTVIAAHLHPALALHQARPLTYSPLAPRAAGTAASCLPGRTQMRKWQNRPKPGWSPRLLVLITHYAPGTLQANLQHTCHSGHCRGAWPTDTPPPLYGLNRAPPKFICWSLTLVSQNTTFFRREIFLEVIK